MATGSVARSTEARDWGPAAPLIYERIADEPSAASSPPDRAHTGCHARPINPNLNEGTVVAIDSETTQCVSARNSGPLKGPQRRSNRAHDGDGPPKVRSGTRNGKRPVSSPGFSRTIF